MQDKPIFLPGNTVSFQEMIHAYYREQGRIQPWRINPDPYRVFVSEIMLQQTQVSRVTEKFPGFIARFPDFLHLAEAELTEILEEWQGLGYNRRARYLRLSAGRVLLEYFGKLPSDEAILVTFPGIGRATAGSIVAFAFNKPVVFIETNIRRVFIHFFFPEDATVDDKDILPLVAETLDRKNPREWYYALLDYGAMLGKKGTNPNRRSRRYTRQSSFSGSDRQVRGAVIRYLLKHQPVTARTIIEQVCMDADRAETIIRGMEQEGIITNTDGIIKIA